MSESEANLAYIGLGGNIGDVPATMAAALNALDREPKIELRTVSPVYLTPPWGLPDQDWYHNACAELSVTVDPFGLLETCLRVERDLKRVRDKRWGPRTIDLDLLVYADVELEQPNLTLPHPRMHERIFVLRPLADLAPGLEFKGRKVGDLAAELADPRLKKLALEKDWYLKQKIS